MGENHLSELCKQPSVEPVLRRLEQIAPLPRSAEVLDGESRVWCDVNFRDADGRTALHWAVALKNAELALTLLRPPYLANTWTHDEDQATPFMTACLTNAAEPLLRELLERSVTSWCASKLQSESHTATASEETAVAQSSGGTPLPPAEADADLAAAAKAAVVNAVDATRNTALLYAAGRDYRTVVQFLLKNRADLWVQNHRGQSALHRAVRGGSLDMVELLVAASSRILQQDKLQLKKWVNLPDQLGNTALFDASMDNNEDIGRFLLRNGADRAHRNKSGKEFWEV